MAKIQQVEFPFGEIATDLIVYVLGFPTSANLCKIQYVLTDENGKQLLCDYYTLTEEEFQGWGEDNTYIDQIAAARIPVTIIAE